MKTIQCPFCQNRQQDLFKATETSRLVCLACDRVVAYKIPHAKEPQDWNFKTCDSKTINVVLISKDCRPISFRAASIKDAAIRALEIIRDPFYNDPHPVIKYLFATERDTLFEYNLNELKEFAGE